MSVIIEDDRLITHCERTAEKTIIIKKEDAIRYGLVKAPIIFHDDNSSKDDVLFLDDSIMNYKYLYDSLMPDCYEKSLKKLRCLLRFYIMLIVPGTPLLTESWDAMRDMNLVMNENDLVPKIKEALAELHANVPPTTD